MIVPLEPTQGFPASPQQRHLWRLQEEGSGVVYSSRALVQVEGELDLRSLERALELLVNRHEILRTTFSLPPGMRAPLQVIGEAYLPALEVRDLAGLPEDHREAEIAEAWARAAEPFDLENGPTLRLSLLRMASGQHRLLVALPALCADAAGLESLVREIAACYAAVRSGQALNDEPLQYADLAQWQRELLESEDGAGGREHWRLRQGADGLDRRLPFERRAPRNAAAPLAAEPVALPSAGIRTLCAERGAAPEDVLLTGWGLLLQTRTGGEPITLAAAADGRRFEDLRGALGPLSKHLPIPFSTGAGAAFSEILRGIGESRQEAVQHQEYFTWETWTRDWTGPHPSLGFAFHPRPSRHSAAGIELELVRGEAWIDRFKLALYAGETADGIAAEIQYDPACFDTADVACLSRQLATLLASAAAAPETPVEALQIADEAELRRLLVEVNDTRRDTLRDLCLHQLIDEQGRARPGHPAVLGGKEPLTYAELNARAERIARHLRRTGVGPEVAVGVLAERSPDMICALLGILKAGGAYVPLDPGYPAERLSLLLEDCAAPVLLVQDRYAPVLPPLGSRTLLLEHAAHTDPEGEEEAGRPPLPGNLAYVIYTSGSTGRPKGVLVSHANAVHSTTARFHWYREPVGRFVLLSSFAFDSSVAGIFWTLGQGGTLLLPSDDLQWDLGKLEGFLERHAATHMLLLPSLYSLLLDQASPERLASLRTVIVAGEACPPELVARHRQRLPGVSLVNEYGPTEATVWCAAAEIGDADPDRPVPIGGPIPNAQTYVLRPDGAPAPVGVAGELMVAGEGITRGYLGRPELTADRFRPHPFATAPGERLYRTGDLARFDVRGHLEYLGRLDQQVKIRGFRIELGEIEAALNAHPSVAQAAVTAREDMPGEKRLCAYLVFRQGTEASELQVLRSALQRRLPEHMVPAVFVILDSLPVGPNGKLDRKALPAPESSRRTSSAEYVAPRSEIERAITEVWCGALQVDKLGVHDNFFDLGGHSLLMVKVHRRLVEVLGREIEVLDLFRFPTVSTLARFLSSESETAVPPPEGEERAETRKTAEDHRADRREKRRMARG
jgi:amino acid adenylation domain-containing protein